MNTLLGQPPYLEECKRIGHEENEDWGTHKKKNKFGRFVERDNNGNLII